MSSISLKIFWSPYFVIYHFGKQKSETDVFKTCQDNLPHFRNTIIKNKAQRLHLKAADSNDIEEIWLSARTVVGDVKTANLHLMICH